MYYDNYDNCNYANAIVFLEKMELSPRDSSWIYAKLAECHYELFNYKEAIRYCKLSLKKQNKYPLPLWTLSNSLYYDHKHKESIKVLNSIINMTEYEIGRIETQLGIVWARSLIMDCYIILADNYYMLNKDFEAKISMDKFEEMKKKKVKSCLPRSYINTMRKKIWEI